MRVLVTGGSGMVGTAVERTCPEDVTGIYVGTKQADLRSLNETEKLFADVRPDAVIHLAAHVGGVKANKTFIADFYYDNIMINTNVLECSKRFGVTKAVSFLSTCVFPDKIQYPIREIDLHAGEPHESNYGYAYAKRMAEVQSRAYREQYGCNFVCIIPNNIYGPNDNYSLEHSHVIPAMTRKIYECSMGGPEVVLWGDGSPLREFSYSDDIALAIWWALFNYNDPMPLNIGTEEEISIYQAAKEICSCLEYDFNRIVWDTTRPSGQFKKPSDKSRLHDMSSLTWRPFRHGIKDAINWFVKNYSTLRKD